MVIQPDAKGMPNSTNPISTEGDKGLENRFKTGRVAVFSGEYGKQKI